MGNTYANLAVVGRSQEQVAQALQRHRRRAWVAPAENDIVIVFDKGVDTLDDKEFERVGGLLSDELHATVLLAAVADSDEFYLALFRDGTRELEYSNRSSKRGANRFARALGRPSAAVPVWLALNAPVFVFQEDRHGLSARLLRIPQWSVANGYRYMSGGEVPDGLHADTLISVGGPMPPTELTDPGD